MVLAAVAGNQERFHYWHDPDRGGVGWFTAAGMLILAFLFARQYFAQHAVKAPPTFQPALPQPPDPRWLLAATVVVLLVARLPLRLAPLEYTAAPPANNLLLAHDLTDKTPHDGPLLANAAIWTRQLQYLERSEGRTWTVLVASLPRTMEPDPRDQPSLDATLPALSGRWQPLPSGGFSAPTSLAGTVWLATVVPGQGAWGADGALWNAQQRITHATPIRWARWLLHRSPLRAKQTYWLAVWGPPTPNSAPPKLFSDWIALLRRAD